MRRDVLEQLLVLTWERQLDARSGSQPADPRRLMEFDGILVTDPIHEVFDRGDRRGRLHFDDARVDEGLTSLPRHGDTVIAVLDEVRLADLVELDRGQLDVREEGGVDALPTSSRASLTRQERTVEVAI